MVSGFTEEERRNCVLKYRAVSGTVGQREYCESKGIPYYSFKNWLVKYKKSS